MYIVRRKLAELFGIRHTDTKYIYRQSVACINIF